MLTFNILSFNKKKTHMRIFQFAISCLTLFSAFSSAGQEQNDLEKKSFPQAMDWENCIKPNHINQEQINNDVAVYYHRWRKNYLKPTTMPGGYYVEGHCTNCKVPSKGTSEGHGFGMIITALMAGQDSLAKQYFDGLFAFFNNHKSKLNNELMGWNVAIDERVDCFDSATDGDMDVAYALLLAHEQWGSDGEINYQQEAIDMINKGIKVSLIDHKTKRMVLGDWDTSATATRTSDLMTAQMRAFGKATNDPTWQEVIDTSYAMIYNIRSNYSPMTGLMPDFATGQPAQPVGEGFLEKSIDGEYSWNACRFPWRIAMDYGHFGTKEAKDAVSPITAWARKQCNDKPADFTAVYKLDGTPIETYKAAAFTAPIIAASIVDKSNQEFLNNGWIFLNGQHGEYYRDSISLLCMLFISGNWWAPTAS